ncbi:MAG TPA: hypothetical protein PK384_09630 [Candidatus Latescibacteria bacterium]|nr:hypothetical protein [Candidatus Latescibacterota bacterium]
MTPSIAVSYEDGEVIIVADAHGLRRISEVCTRLADLSPVEAATPAGHFHISEAMKNAEAGSLPLVVARKQD